MAVRRELVGENGERPTSRSVLRIVFGVISAVLIAYFVFTGLRLATVWSLYAYLLRLVVQETGLDLRWARPVVLASMAIVAVIPWWSFVLPWRTGRRGRALIVGLLMAALSAGLGFATENVFFDPYGRPARFYAIVPGGYRLSDSGGVDRQYGVAFKAITPVVARQILTWERAGRSPRMQSVPCNPAFDLYSGEPTCWFDRDGDGRLRFSPVPGFDPETGEALEAVTRIVIDQFESATTRDAQRQRVVTSPEFANTHVVLSDPPSFVLASNVDGQETANHADAGTQVVGELVLPKHQPTLPAPETADGFVALAVQHATGLVPRERILFRVTNDVVSGGEIVLPQRSVAEGEVSVWTPPLAEHEIRVAVVFSRIWLRGRTHPVAFRAHLTAGNNLLVMGAINSICLDEPFSGTAPVRRLARSVNGERR